MDKPTIFPLVAYLILTILLVWYRGCTEAHAHSLTYQWNVLNDEGVMLGFEQLPWLHHVGLTVSDPIMDGGISTRRYELWTDSTWTYERVMGPIHQRLGLGPGILVMLKMRSSTRTILGETIDYPEQMEFVTYPYIVFHFDWRLWRVYFTARSQFLWPRATLYGGAGMRF